MPAFEIPSDPLKMDIYKKSKQFDLMSLAPEVSLSIQSSVLYATKDDH